MLDTLGPFHTRLEKLQHLGQKSIAHCKSVEIKAKERVLTGRVITFGFIIIVGIMGLLALAKPARAQDLNPVQLPVYNWWQDPMVIFITGVVVVIFLCMWIIHKHPTKS